MKLVLAIVKDEDAFNIMTMLNNEGYSVTKLASTGGFLKIGSTTLISGVDDEKVDNVIEIIKNQAHSKTQFTSNANLNSDNYLQAVEVTIGGATVFVLDIDQFIKI
ncbi:MAG: cyclic-di-AMP receptor [bacterium]